MGSTVRRITGGGAVYHDLNNLNYTIISDEEEGEGAFDFKHSRSRLLRRWLNWG